MKHSPLMLILLSGSLLCTACSHAAPEAVSNSGSSIPDVSTESNPVDTIPDIGSAADTVPVPADIQSDAAVLIPLPEISQPDYQGGVGGEEHAETPLPQYFTFRFFESGISVRLAGGNYQTLDLDLSGISPEDAEGGYYLFDSDFDGDLDLSVPTVYTDTHKEFAVFLWNDADAHFAETPVMLSNPQYFPEEKHVTTLSQSEIEAIVQDCIWQEGTVFPILTARLNVPDRKLELIQSNPDGTTMATAEQLPDTANLIGELMRYYNRKYTSPASTKKGK